ncbi:phage tail tape measure protein [Campylobacter majalis]|uniref:phage tail tape measure protein n=1 Tax=Campylobacter majalis TaxID=2790656 RepID=UPI003D6894FB
MANPTLTFNMELKGLDNILKAVNKSGITLNDKLTDQMSAGVKKYNEALKTLKVNPFQGSKFHADLARLKENLQKATIAKVKLNMDEAKAKISNLKGEIIAAVGSVAAIATPIKLAMDFESSMADVKKVIDFETPQELKAFSSEIINMSKSIPMTAEGLSQIAASGAQMGIAKDEVLKFTDMAAKVAVAFDTTAEAAGTNIGKIKNILNISIDETGRLMDAINHLSDNNAAKASEMVEVMKRIAGIGKQVGITKEQTAALSATFISLGKAPETAASAAEALLKKLNGVLALSGNKKEAFESLGFSIKKFAKKMKTDAQGAIFEFLHALEKIDPQKRGVILSQFMGLNYDSDIATLVSGIDIYKKAVADVSDPQNYANSALKEFQNRSNTAASKLQQLKNSISALSISIGDIFLPYLHIAFEKLAAFVNKIETFTQNNQSLVKAIALSISGLVALKTAFLVSKIASAAATFSLNGYRQILMLLPFDCLKIQGVNSACAVSFKRLTQRIKNNLLYLRLYIATSSGASGILKDFGGIALMAGKKIAGFGLQLVKLPFTALRLAIAALFSPIGLMASAFITAGVLIYKFWHPIKAFFIGFADGFKSAFDPIFSVVSSAFTPLKPLFNWFKNIFSAIFSQVQLTSDEFESAKNAGEAFGKAVAGAINLILTPLKWVIDGLSSVKDLASQAMSNFDFSSSSFNPKNWFNSSDTKQTPKIDTKGAISAYKAQSNKTSTINDNKTINITMHNSNATPTSIAKAIKNNSYSYGD